MPSEVQVCVKQAYAEGRTMHELKRCAGDYRHSHAPVEYVCGMPTWRQIACKILSICLQLVV